MANKIELTGNDVWRVETDMSDLGSPARMELVKHVWDSRHSSKLTGFEYLKSRGTRNMLNPARPVLDEPRGTSAASARWTPESLEVKVACRGRDKGDDLVVVALLPVGKETWCYDCSRSGRMRLSRGDGFYSASVSGEDVFESPAPASCTVEEEQDVWIALFTIPWSVLRIRPRPGLQLPFNVVRIKDWTDVQSPEMLPDGYLVNGFTRITAGLEMSTLSKAVRCPTVQEPFQPERLGALVLSPPLALKEVALYDSGLSKKSLKLNLEPSRRLQDTVDLTVTLVDPYGRKQSFAESIPSRGDSIVDLEYLFGAYRGFLYPYRIVMEFTDPESGMAPASRRCAFIPERRVRIDSFELDHEQRGTGRFRLKGEGVGGSTWRVSLVDDAGKEWKRGRLEASADEDVFEVEIGEIPRGRYRLRLRLEGTGRECFVECLCTVMGKRERPVVLATPSELERIRVGIKRDGLKPYYEKMKSRVNEVKERGTIREMSWAPEGMKWREITLDDTFLKSDEFLMQCLDTRETLFQRNPSIMMECALVYLIEDDREYGILAGKMAQVLINHVLWGDPRVYAADTDFISKAMFCALILDWLSNLLTPEERWALRDSVYENGLMVYLWSMENDRAYWKRNIANLTTIADSAAVAMALALKDDVLDAEEVLAVAREDIRTPMRAVPPDGSWQESINYWSVFFSGLVFHGVVMESAIGTDDGIFSLPGVKNAGYFPLYFTPRGVPTGFNDGMGIAASRFLHLLARKYEKPLFSFYADAYAETPVDANPHADWYTILWRSPKYEYLEPAKQTAVGDIPAPPALASKMKLETLKVYKEIRWAAVASSWPKPELYFSLKSGYAMQGFGHTSLDLNSIQVVAGGEPLIRRSHSYRTPPDGYSTVMIEGKTQSEATGTFVYWKETEKYRVVAAEADRSFGEKVRKVRRHAVMVDGRYIVVADEIEAEEPVALTFMAHIKGKLDLSDCRAGVEGVETCLTLTFVSPHVSLKEVGTPLCVHERLTERGVHATTEAGKEIVLITVIWPEKKKLSTPQCSWDGEWLAIARPDGARDRLRFRKTPEGRIVSVQ